MSGLPGSGKSYLAKTLNGLILSTDDYFYDSHNVYQYNPKQIPEAHEWNQKRAFEAFKKGVSRVIVDNTSVEAWEAKPYVVEAIKYNYSVVIREPETEWWKRRDLQVCAEKNSHGVTLEILSRMYAKWQDEVTVESILKSQMPVRPMRKENNNRRFYKR